MILAPLAVVEPRPVSAVELQRSLAPYGETLFLLHGYRFFAPEPGPSHLVEYQVTTIDGQKVNGVFPDRNTMWPRQLYHRWFMLSETVFQHVSGTLGPDELEQWTKEIQQEIESLIKTAPNEARRLEDQLQSELAEHNRFSRLRDLLVTGIGKHLLRRHKGSSVRLKMLTRVIPTPQDIAQGISLDNKRYLPEDLEFPLGVVYADSDQLETITPSSEDSDPNVLIQGQGRGVGQ